MKPRDLHHERNHHRKAGAFKRKDRELSLRELLEEAEEEDFRRVVQGAITDNEELLHALEDDETT